MINNRRILILEPYFGGSHRQFLEGLSKTIDAEFIWLTLPARKWKMRMQLSALWFAEQIEKFGPEKGVFETVICSTFVDVAVLKAMLLRIDWWDSDTRIVTYFHENQFVYPSRIDDRSMFQFTAINFLTAVSSDAVAFNSRFNMQTFLDGCTRYLKKAADMNLKSILRHLQDKCQVIYPGMDLTLIDHSLSFKQDNEKPIIVWNHRWEHDKGPVKFFNALYRLKKEEIPFALIILGESFKNSPSCFVEAKEKLADEIIHFGYADSYEEYIHLLSQGDVVVSSANHEFFGLAVIEAIRAGCRPVLPARLAYPELYEKRFLYNDKGLYSALKNAVLHPQTFSLEEGRIMTERFDWSRLKPQYEEFIFRSEEFK